MEGNEFGGWGTAVNHENSSKVVPLKKGHFESEDLQKLSMLETGIEFERNGRICGHYENPKDLKINRKWQYISSQTKTHTVAHINWKPTEKTVFFLVLHSTTSHEKLLKPTDWTILWHWRKLCGRLLYQLQWTMQTTPEESSHLVSKNNTVDPRTYPVHFY